VFAISVIVQGCSLSERGSSSRAEGTAVFDPVPAEAERETIAGQLKRFDGQTKFLTPSFQPMYAAAGEAKGGAQRAIQESDVFKVGRAGSKLLYLLNNARGLQVVSFAEGSEAPKLVGSVSASGNWPQDMYFDEARERLAVLESLWYDAMESASQCQPTRSRLVIYDVSRSERPLISRTLEFDGEVADSRMVGDILYVAAAVRSSGYCRAEDSAKGMVYAFRFGAREVELLKQQPLQLPTTYRENMNVVEVPSEEGYRYYLIAVLSGSGGWWDQKSVIEVVDISSPSGEIKPVMIATAKGFVNERSQTFIKNDTLLVTSNYWPGDDTTRRARVAVESFQFPSSRGEIITQDEADFRRLNMQRIMARKTAEWEALGFDRETVERELEKLKITLAADPEEGLKGRFVRVGSADESTTLKKLMPDSVVTVGSTQDLSARLQDVRVDGDRLYVFWVPANNLDPLDVFDIARPQDGIRHLGHLEFDGWMQRAFPVRLGERRLIVGLGWIIPAVDNESQRRYPQAALFEVNEGRDGRLKLSQREALTLTRSNVWANFDAPDKMIEFRVDDAGKGTIMFEIATEVGGEYVDGGKLVGFDLSKADDGGVFKEGGLLVSEGTWLRRMFTNPEIDKVNAFTDTSLGTFAPARELAGVNAVHRAISTLELARDIRAFANLTGGLDGVGIQLVSEGDVWSARQARTELRVVPLDRADSERGQVAQTLTLKGFYTDHEVRENGRLMFVLTQANRKVTADNGQVRYPQELRVSMIAPSQDSKTPIKVMAEQGWTVDERPNNFVGGFWGHRFAWRAQTPELVASDSASFLVYSQGDLRRVVWGGESLSVEKLSEQDCAGREIRDMALVSLGGKPFLTWFEPVEDPERVGLSYERHMIAPMGEPQARVSKSVCERAINIPGTPKALLAGDHLVAEDRRLLDLVETRGEDGKWTYAPVTASLMSLVTLGGRQAVLRDGLDTDEVEPEAIHTLGQRHLAYVETKQRRWFDGGSRHRLVVLGVDDDNGFTQRVWDLGSELPESISLTHVLGDAEHGWLGVLGNFRQARVFSLSPERRPMPLKVRLMGETSGETSPKPVDALRVEMPYYGWYGGSGEFAHWTQVNDTLEFSQGLSGIRQVKIIRP
jgi:hypothetical protein